MAQLVYSKDPAIAIKGQMAEPMAPHRIMSGIAQDKIGVGMPVQRISDKVVAAGEGAGFYGFTVMQDYLESKPTGVVDAGTGEIMTEVAFEAKQQCGVMVEGVIFVEAGEDLSSTALGAELFAVGGKVEAAGTPGLNRIFLEEVPAGGADTLVKVRLAGPQGA